MSEVPEATPVVGPEVLVERRDGVARLTLNRPGRRNAITPQMVVLLADAWRDISADPLIRVVLLTGAGETFCAGADLGRLIPLLTRARGVEDEWDERLMSDRMLMNAAMLRNVTFDKPVVAAINGHAVAGGAEILLGCDLRIMSEEARFGITEVRRGLVPAAGTLSKLTRQVGWTDAMELVMLGEHVTAARAKEMGLVNRVVPKDQVLACAEDFAAKVAKGAPVALSQAKKAMVLSNGHPIEKAFEFENDAARVVLRTEDAKEGPRAFMEKREPVFQGR